MELELLDRLTIVRLITNHNIEFHPHGPLRVSLDFTCISCIRVVKAPNGGPISFWEDMSFGLFRHSKYYSLKLPSTNTVSALFNYFNESSGKCRYRASCDKFSGTSRNL